MNNFYIVALDQKKAFDAISREYIFTVLIKYGFPDTFISMIKCLYKVSKIHVNVNGSLTDAFLILRD
uniref:Reverse transcriptase domain-containing protein n=1 Tax=Astyanax mexicanus TaxID=7994 RepID=A0A3B1JCC3_ASTMX